MIERRVLIVDDSKVSRLFIRNYLAGLRPQWQLFEADGGEAALAVTSEQPLDAVSLDYNMPGQNGLLVAAAIQRRHPGCFIGLLTANIQPAIEAQARQYGVRFYRKPVTESVIAALVADIEQHLDGKGAKPSATANHD